MGTPETRQGPPREPEEPRGAAAACGRERFAWGFDPHVSPSLAEAGTPLCPVPPAARLLPSEPPDPAALTKLPCSFPSPRGVQPSSPHFSLCSPRALHTLRAKCLLGIGGPPQAAHYHVHPAPPILPQESVIQP